MPERARQRVARERPAGPDPAAALGLTGQDSRLVGLARAARARAGAIEGAALRDGDGREFTGATVSLPSLSVSAIQLAVANAVAAGAMAVEAVAVVTEASTVDAADCAAVRDLSTNAPVHAATPAGELFATL